MKKLMFVTTLITSVILLNGCAGNLSPNVYDAQEAGVASKVDRGVIVAKRRVKIDANTNVGGLAGAATGAVAGSAIGDGPRTNIAGALGGAVIGGVLGNAIEKGIQSRKAHEYIVQLKNGSTIAVSQVDEIQFEVHDPVLVIYGGMTRIVHDTTVPGSDECAPSRIRHRRG